jgi:hypothetical protein
VESPPPDDVESPPPEDVDSPPPEEVDNPPPEDVDIPPPADVESPPPEDVDIPPPEDVESPPPDEVDNPPPLDVERSLGHVFLVTMHVYSVPPTGNVERPVGSAALDPIIRGGVVISKHKKRRDAGAITRCMPPIRESRRRMSCPVAERVPAANSIS